MTESMDISEQKPNIFTKLSDIPVVSSSYNGLLSAYYKTKEYSMVTKYTLGMAEMSLAIVANSTMPVVNKFEKPISAAHDFACQRLDTLEEAYPIIMKPTDTVLSSVKDEAMQVWENTKQKGMTKMDGLKDTPIARMVNSSVDVALSLSELVVDHYLPPASENKPENVGEGEDTETGDGEEKEVAAKDQSTLGRVSVLSSKVRRRLMRVAMQKIQHAQKRTQESVDSLKFSVNLLDYAKSNLDYASDQISSKAGDAKTKVWDTWNEWTTEDGEGSPEDQEQEKVEGTVAVLHDLCKRLKVATSKLAVVSVSYVPQSVMNAINLAKSSASSLYQSIVNFRVEGLKDLPTSWLDSAKAMMNNASEMLNQLTDYLTSFKPLDWLMTSSRLKAVLPSSESPEFEAVPSDDNTEEEEEEDLDESGEETHMQ